MNERHLFRGQRWDNDEWVTGDLVLGKYPVFKGLKEPLILNDEGVWEVDPATIGQCTGIKDTNVRLVFEGDIVCSFGQLECDWPGTVDYIGVVVWDAEACGFYVNDTTLEAFCVDYVQGNIHDNPELVKG